MAQNEKYNVTGMTCASCQMHVEKAVSHLKEVKECNVNLMMNSMTVTYDGKLTSDDIIHAVEKAGYGASLSDKKESTREDKTDNKDSKSALIRLILSIILLVPLFYISMAYMTMGDWNWPLGTFGENPFYIGLTEMALSLCIMLLNYRFFTSGFKSLIHGGANMDTLVALATSVAFLYSFAMMFVMSFYAKENEWNKVMMYSMNLSFETSGMVPTLISIGKTLETISKGKTTSAIRSLLDMAPKSACILKDGEEKMVSIDLVRTDDVFLVKPGESIPVDGVVLSGSSAVDESILTGESIPVDKEEGANVSSGTMNKNGTLICKATKVGNETTLNQIVKMVEEASGTKTHISRIADKVAGVFVPIVLSIAFIVFLFWLIFGNGFVQSVMPDVTTLSYALERAVAVLVISCPCALGLATPVAIMVGNGKAARNGILFKNAAAMEETGKIDYVVLDKTGTITKGEVKVNDVLSFTDENELLEISYSLESLSEHPLSNAITDYAKEKNVNKKECSSFKALPGFGLEGIIDGETCFGGNEKLMKEKGVDTSLAAEAVSKQEEQGRTSLYFAKGNRLLGVYFVSDTIKEDSKEAIEKMREEGLTVIMLTGDNEKTARKIADTVGVDTFVSNVLPDGKLAVIQELKKHGKVMMVGDGINDAPALTEADIGVAIKKGSDIAIDSADAVLMKSSLMDALKAIRLSKHVLWNIKENLFWAFIYNIVMIPIASGAFSSLGLYSMKPWMGAAAMSLSSLTVVLNALRINLFSLDKKRKAKKKKEVPSFLMRGEVTKTKEVTISIPDMMCENCVKHIKDGLSSLKGVVKVDVSLEKKEAVVRVVDTLSISILLDKIVELGYQASLKENE